MGCIKLASFVMLVMILWKVRPSHSGSSCPPYESIKPCFCSATDDGQTTMICAGVNSTQLMTATIAMKSMILDRFMLLGAFRKVSLLASLRSNEVEIDDDEDIDEPANEDPSLQRLPKRWLASVRVKAIEIQDSALSSCFLCDEPLFGQSEFLSTLIATHSSLTGYLCSVCNTKIAHVSTRELLKTPDLKLVDFSYNNLKVVSGVAFPDLKSLKTVILSNNKIARVYDKAFENLPQLTELDLSYNKLTSISRKIFRDVDSSLKSLDLSWNSLQSIPENMFLRLRALREVKLSHNLLEVLSETPFTQLPTLMERIDVKGNFLVCNCSLSWINRKLQKNTKLIGKCVAPKEVELQDVKSNLASLQSC